MAGGYVWQGRGSAWQGAMCGKGGVRGKGGGHAWQERQPLQWTVRIPLECIVSI